MKNPFPGLFRARDKPARRASPRDAVSAAPGFYYGASLSGKSVTPTSAIQVSAAYACVRVIAETVASLPLHVYEATDAGSRKAGDHPLYRLLHDKPNTEMTSFVWRETMLSHLLLYGNSYCQIIRSGRGNVVGLYPLLPDRMAVDRDGKGKLTYTYTTSDGKLAYLAPEDVLHIPGLGFDGVMGYSPIALEKAAIGLGIAAEEYGSRFFANGARPSGILTHPNTGKDPAALRAYPGNVHIIVSGTAASAATVLAMAADRLEMTPGSLWMIHDPSVMAWGNERDLEEAVRLLKACKENILNVYGRRCRKARDEIGTMMRDTTWMDAGQALQDGFIDGIADLGGGVLDAACCHEASLAEAKEKVQNWLDRWRPARGASTAQAPQAPGTPVIQLQKRLALITPTKR